MGRIHNSSAKMMNCSLLSVACRLVVRCILFLVLLPPNWNFKAGVSDSKNERVWISAWGWENDLLDSAEENREQGSPEERAGYIDQRVTAQPQEPGLFQWVQSNNCRLCLGLGSCPNHRQVSSIPSTAVSSIASTLGIYWRLLATHRRSFNLLGLESPL